MRKIPGKLEKPGKFEQNRRNWKIREIREIRITLESLGKFGKYEDFPENQDHMTKSEIVELLGVVANYFNFRSSGTMTMTNYFSKP